MTEYYDALETRTPERREADLLAALKVHLAESRRNAPALAPHLEGAGEEGSIGEILARLPLVRKSELPERQRANLPFGGLSAIRPPVLTHVFASPGPIYEPGAGRSDFWRFARALFAAGFRAGDLVHNCFSYHFTPAGMMVESGARALGCAVVPAGPGQTELQVRTVADLRPQGYVGTPSFLKIILEKGEEMGEDLGSVRKALVSGEALPGSLREWFVARGIEVRQCYATADVGLIAYEGDGEGLIVDEGVILEIVRPGTGECIPDGEVGEVVVTPLTPEYPLLRFATGDLSAILTGTNGCGRSHRRIRGWLGRADQSAKVRGMFVHPSQVAQVLKRHPEVGRSRLLVGRENDNDTLVLQCELASARAGLAEAMAATIRDICKLRGDVCFVPPGSLPNDGKVIEDLRQVG